MKKYYWKKAQNRENVVKDRYFVNQILKPKFSTVSFFKFLSSKISLKKSFIDIGCGNGANLFYLKKKYKFIDKSLGIDINPHLIKFANEKFSSKKLKFKKQNILKFNKFLKNKFDVAMCLQVLPYLDDYEKTIDNIAMLNTKYFAFSCILWEGLLDYNIKINFLKNKKSPREIKYYKFYNIYSLQNLISYIKKKGFKKNYIKKFEVDKNIKIKDKTNIGTYTIRDKKKYIQMSGPIKMNWYFILAKR